MSHPGCYKGPLHSLCGVIVRLGHSPCEHHTNRLPAEVLRQYVGAVCDLRAPSVKCRQQDVQPAAELRTPCAPARLARAQQERAVEEARLSGGRRSAHAAACRQRDCRASERGGSGAGRRGPGESAVVCFTGTCAARRPRRGADGKRRQQGAAHVLARSGRSFQHRQKHCALQKTAGEYTTWTGAATMSLAWCGGTRCYTDACAPLHQAQDGCKLCRQQGV